MRKTLWYMYKPGDARDYAMTTPPSPVWAEAMRKEGFKLFECLVDIPHEVALEGYGDAVPEGTTEVPLGLLPLELQEDRTPEQQKQAGDVQELCVHCGTTERQSKIKHKRDCRLNDPHTGS